MEDHRIVNRICFKKCLYIYVNKHILSLFKIVKVQEEREIMKCKKCGSENVKVEIVNEINYKTGHGCLFTILFGIFYWTWLMLKWIYKYIMFAVYWITWGWISLIISKIQGKNFRQAEWLCKLMQKSGKNYNVQKSVAVCQDCGFRKTI